MLLLAACAANIAPASASDSTYDLLIFACDRNTCTRIVEQKLSAGLTNIAQYNRNGLKLVIETLARRTNEEDTRVSLDVRAPDDGPAGALKPVSLAQRLDTFVVTLRQRTFSPLTSYVSDGTTYQVWARLASMR
jgi:hypothetical protein